MSQINKSKTFNITGKINHFEIKANGGNDNMEYFVPLALIKPNQYPFLSYKRKLENMDLDKTEIHLFTHPENDSEVVLNIKMYKDGAIKNGQPVANVTTHTYSNYHIVSKDEKVIVEFNDFSVTHEDTFAAETVVYPLEYLMRSVMVPERPVEQRIKLGYDVASVQNVVENKTGKTVIVELCLLCDVNYAYQLEKAYDAIVSHMGKL